MSAEVGDLPSAVPPVDVAVVIVTHNSAAVLGACLDALPRALEGIGTRSVIVVDNASNDGTQAIVAGHDIDAELVEMGVNRGYAAGVNAGARRRPGARHVLVLNPDVRLRPGSVRSMVDAAGSAEVGIVVPRLVDCNGELHHSLRREPSIKGTLASAVFGGRRAGRLAVGELVVDRAAYERAHPTDWATGAVMLLTRRCLDTVGLFDERFFLYSEETEYMLRARDRGLVTWYEPSAEAVHLGGESATSPVLWKLLVRNQVRLYRMRHGWWRAVLFWMATALGEAIRTVVGGPTHRHALAGLFDYRSPVPPPDAESAPANDWICFSAQDWWYFNRAHSDFQLMRRIAERRRVLFINSIGMRMPLPGRSTQAGRRILRKIRSVFRLIRRPLPETPGFHVVTPVILPFYGVEWVRALNARLVRWQAKVLARFVGIDHSCAAIMVTIPTAQAVVENMEHGPLIFNRSDLHSAFDEADRSYIAALEHRLLEAADHVLYTSRALMERERSLVGDRGVFLDHGVDVAQFVEHGPAPADIVELPRPRVGFVGTVRDHVVDVDLVERVATSIPSASVVVVGDATTSVSHLNQLDNVYLLGQRPYESVPSYLAELDVGLLPFKRNEWIQYANPIKLKEYLAAGLPVVSTDFPEIHWYGDVVAIARDADEFVSMVDEALDGRGVGTPTTRRRRVEGASWDSLATTLLRLGTRTCAGRR